MAHHHGHTGSSLGGKVEMSRSAAKARRKKRQREEKMWAAKSGPVIIRTMTPEDRKRGN